MFKGRMKYIPEALGAVICLALGMLSGYGMRAEINGWFLNINKPSFQPPNWLFAPVWTILYIMIGIVLVRLFKQRKENSLALMVFGLQFILNLVWSPIFFHLHRMDYSLMVIIALWFSLVWLIFLVRKDRTTMLMLLPYLAWISFASILNLQIYQLN